MSFTASLDEIVRENRSGLLSTASHWERVRLGDIATILNGFPFPSARFTRSKGMPLLRIRDVGRISTEACFDGDFDPTFLVEPGELVVGMDGDFKAALWGGPRALLNQRVCKITPDEAVYRRRFLAYVLPGYLDAINAHTSSITVKHLSSRTVADIPLPLPPLPEQDRIIAALDALFTRLEAAVGALERVRANLKRYRAAVLKAACEGRLVPTEAELARRQGRDYEPADLLLQRILRERRARWEAEELERLKAKGKPPTDDRWKQKYKEPEPLDTNELPSLPEGWTWATVAQLGFVRSGQTPSGIQEACSPEGIIPFYRVGDMNHPANKRELHHADCWLSPNDIAQLKLNVQPPGTIVFPKRGGAIATNKKRLLSRPSCYDLNTMGIIPVPSVAAYLWWWFQGVDLASLGDGSNVPQINHDDIESLVVPLPPHAEQQRIVSELEKCLSGVGSLDEEAQKCLRRSERLRLSILQHAFSGRLVPQDPNDEPASALLERIRAQRHEQTELAIARSTT